MREKVGTIWTANADVRVIPVTGVVDDVERAVMDDGIAYEAEKRYPTLPLQLGWHLLHWEGVIPVLWFPPDLVIFRWHWHWQALLARADQLHNMQHSARELVAMADLNAWHRIALPRVGCEAPYGFTWDEVQPVLAALFDDRFTVYHQEKARCTAKRRIIHDV